MITSQYFIAIAATVALLSGSIANGQDSQPLDATQVTEVPGSSNPFSNNAQGRFDLQFSGGTVVSLLDAIHKATGKRPNVIIPEEEKEAHFPSFHLTAVSLSDLFAALSLATDFTFESHSGSIWVLKGPRATSRPSFVSRQTAGAGRATPVTTQRGGGRSTNAAGAWSRSGSPRVSWDGQDEISTQPVAVGDLLSTFEIQDITTAILQTWEGTGKDHPGKIAFHKDAALLILTGTPGQLGVADAVIDQLQVEADRRAREEEVKKTASQPR